MAYGKTFSKGTGTNSGTTAAAATAHTGSKSAGVLLRTGLFAPRNENSKAIATVQIKEDVVIKAGSWVNVYENERKGENQPLFSMQIREGVLKKQA